MHTEKFLYYEKVITVSIILPVYNPSPGWADNLLRSTGKLIGSMDDVRFDIIVVNDGSDNAAYHAEKGIIALSYMRLIHSPRNQGKGAALRIGIPAAEGELIVYTDIDMPYTLDSIAQVITALRTGRQDVVIGVKDAHYYDHVPFFRRSVSRLLRLFVRRYFRILTDDFMVGLKGFNAKGKGVFMQTSIDRYLFDLDFMVLLSRRDDLRIVTQEVHLKDNVQFRSMTPKIVWTEVRDLFRILSKSRRG